MSINGLNILGTNNSPNIFGSGTDGNLTLAANEEVIVFITRQFQNITLGANSNLRICDRVFVSDTLLLDDGAIIQNNGFDAQDQ